MSRDRTAWFRNRSPSLVYVGYGGKDAGKDYGEIGIIDARKSKLVGNIRVVAHPSELLLDKAGTTLFVFISIANQLQVIDTTAAEQLGVPTPKSGDSESPLQNRITASVQVE